MIEPRILKGFRDQLPEQCIPRERMLTTLKKVFDSFGFVPIDTPALEYSEILLGKGSEETDKQLYRFVDNGQRDIALRFDLTIPLARFVAMHINDLGTPFKRYHIAPVWRAEKPQRGRYREFIQCDFDIIGVESVSADAEIVSVIHESLRALDVNHQVRINNRVILNGLLETLGAQDRMGSVLRAIDKLEKQGREVVTGELQEFAKLSSKQIEQLFLLLELSKAHSSAAKLLAELKKLLSASPSALQGVEQLENLSSLVTAYGLAEKDVRIDLSIARGLDYYTGIVFETVFLDLPEFGSICSGGRYDNLASVYTNRRLPGVGASIGLDRLLGALEELGRLGKKSSTAAVLVTVIDETTELDCIRIAHELRQVGIAVELYPERGKLGNQLKYGGRKGINYAVIAGSREVSAGTVSVKNLSTGEQTDNIPLTELVVHFKKFAL